MAMDEGWGSVGDFGGGWDSGSSLPTDFGSFDASSYDLGQNFGSPQIGTQQSASDMWSQVYGDGSAAPGAGAQQGTIPGLGGMGGLNSLPGLLGLLGGGAGLMGTLMGGAKTSQTPVMSTPQKAAGNEANALYSQGPLSQLAAGTNPLQQMQMSLLQALAGGQGLPPAYQQLIEQAFQPQLGSLYQQATNQGRSMGFFDAPATSPAGGAVLGPGLAALQGQEAQAKLGLMQSMPGTFQAPINAQTQAANSQAGGLAGLFGAYPKGQTTTGNLPQQVGSQLGGGLQGMGQTMALNNIGASTRDLYGGQTG